VPLSVNRDEVQDLGDGRSAMKASASDFDDVHGEIRF
jgi:hypothetical protein